MRWLRPFIVALVLTGCASAADTQSSDEELSQAPMENFHKVRAGLYRGGHPNTSGIAFLKKIGVKTIIDLEIADFIEATPWSIDQELGDAKKAGITVVRHPMSAFDPGVSREFDQMMSTITSQLSELALEPVYVHCAHGQDRTGLVIGLERVFDEGWAPVDAHAEMLADGFHTEFVGLNHYFEEKTGFED